MKKISFEGFVGLYNFHILPVVDEGLKIGLEHRQPDNDFELCRSLMKLFFLMRKLIFSLNFEEADVYPLAYTSKMAD